MMAAKIDLVTMSANEDVVVLVMSEMGAWDGATERLRRIQARVNDYLIFALDGELHRRFPDLVEKKIHIRIDCDHSPDSVSREFFAKMTAAVEAYGVSFSVELLPRRGSA